MIIPAHLVSGTTHVRALFDTKRPFKVGDQVTIEGDDERRWDVIEIQPLHSGCFYKRGWNNNI